MPCNILNDVPCLFLHLIINFPKISVVVVKKFNSICDLEDDSYIRAVPYNASCYNYNCIELYEVI